ncbi:transglutaminase-like domain-containing protein [Actinopolymorpha sp. B17G11]|uniref:transglutaminase-like domain-containing protein n=1 Tax=Actinopolymorpha sp. B17G11 TaxID=3160861 RepID=UPI0032E4F8F6
MGERWRELFQLTGGVPPPPVELLEWPDPEPVLAVTLYRLPPERERLLSPLLPAPGATGWETARALTEWVSGRWQHANDHVERYDAVEILARVDAGARFACDEYSVVLCHALNAYRIPARWLGLFRRNHHAGVAAAHSVAEAWIDEPCRWVVLDGQNGAHWVDDAGEPLGVIELQEAFHRGGARPRFLNAAGSVDDADFWWQYFASAQTTGLTSPPSSDLSWASDSYSPIFQQHFLLGTERLLRSARPAYPDLSSVWIGVAGSAERPALTFGTDHPYPRGFAVADGRGLADLPAREPMWPLDMSPGDHVAEVSLLSPYARMPAGPVRYRVG